MPLLHGPGWLAAGWRAVAVASACWVRRMVRRTCVAETAACAGSPGRVDCECVAVAAFTVPS
eukprot:COSAG01_NODE_4193_length_5256_cov_258.864456_3_plen_62_part_00